MPDNDKSGIEFAKQVEKSILNYCYRVKTLIISDKEKGDISDWFEEGNHVAQLLDKLKEVSPKCAKWYNVSKNGLYDIKNNILKPHSKEYVSSVQLKCNYNENPYNAGKWDKYIKSIEFKGVDSFNYRFPGIIVFACNDMPYLGNDKGEHFYNRFNILQCNNVIPKNAQNPFIADEIFDEESDYVFKLLVKENHLEISLKYFII